jgi:hypothetical protein
MSTLDENEFDDMNQDDIDEDIIEDPDVINDPELTNMPDDLDDDDIDELNQDDQDIEEEDNDIEEDNGSIEDFEDIDDIDLEDGSQIVEKMVKVDNVKVDSMKDNEIKNAPILIDTNKYTSDNKLLHKTREELIREINKRLKKEDYISSLKKNTVLESSNKPSIAIIVAPQDRITSDLLKKEETSYILSVRATHIAKYGYPESMLDIVKNETNCRAIAKLELLNKRTPLLLIRKVGDNIYEIWNIREELKINSLFLNI